MPETKFCGDTYRDQEQLYAVWQKMTSVIQKQIEFHQQHLAKLNTAYERARSELSGN